MGLMDTSVPMLADKEGKPQKHPLNDWYRTPNMERLAKQGVRFLSFMPSLSALPRGLPS
jgi:arylsulfatase A-like enzyme